MSRHTKRFKELNFAVDAFAAMNDLRLLNCLCDVSLKVGKREFRAHRIVLSGVSPYLRAMFTNGMLETAKDVIEIQGIEEKVMELLLEFAYCGEINISIENVQQLLAGSSLLAIASLRAACARFLQNQLDSSNCLGIKEFACLYACTELEGAAQSYINQNFLDVVNSEEFLLLPFEKLLRLLNSDSIQVRSEEDVYSSFERWLYHDFDIRKEYVSEMLNCIRIPLLSLEFLECRVFSSPYIKASTRCQLFLARVMNESHELLPKYLYTQRALPPSIYAIGGRNGVDCQLDCLERYDPYEDKWIREESMSIARTAVGAASLDGLIYAVGGECAINAPHDDTLYLPYVECFDAVSRVWLPVADISIARSFVSVAILNGLLYAIGGEDRTSSYNIVERYNPKTNCWTLVMPMKKRRSGSGVAVHEGLIYVAGGYDRGVHCDRASVERYDPDKDDWSFVAELECARSGLSLVSLDAYIYAVGGRNRAIDSYFNLCERYNPTTLQWTAVSSMHSARAWSGVGVLRGCIFVMGGFDGLSRLASVEMYDPEHDRWKRVSSMNIARAGCGAAVM